MNDDEVHDILAHMSVDRVGMIIPSKNNQLIARFDDMEKRVIAFIRNSYPEDDSKYLEGWNLIYHGIVAGSGSIRSNGTQLSIFDGNLDREYYHIRPIVEWIFFRFHSIRFPTDKLPRFSKYRELMNEPLFDLIPWDEISIVHYESKTIFTL